MVPPFVRLSRRLRSLSTARNLLGFLVSYCVVMLVPSAVRTLWRELVSVSGSVRSAERSLLEVLGLSLLLLPWLWDPRFRDFAVLRLRLKLIFDSWNSDLLFISTNIPLFIGILFNNNWAHFMRCQQIFSLCKFLKINPLQYLYLSMLFHKLSGIIYKTLCNQC